MSILCSKTISIPAAALDTFIEDLTNLGYSALYLDFSIVCYRDKNKVVEIVLFGERILSDIRVKELIVEYLI